MSQASTKTPKRYISPFMGIPRSFKPMNRLCVEFSGIFSPRHIRRIINQGKHQSTGAKVLERAKEIAQEINEEIEQKIKERQAG